jgi:energy-coupling factor transport system ATP-binding protein
MEKGEIKMSGTPKELFRHSEMIRSYGLDSPVAARIASGLRDRGFSLPDDILLSEELASSLCQLL